ncbi:MAG: DUF1657 domain-containing protein [Patescibacteria group bacterium]
MTVGSQVKQTLAGLKGAQATLRAYATQTQKEETVSVYREALAATEEIIGDLERRLRTLEFEEPQYKGF